MQDKLITALAAACALAASPAVALDACGAAPAAPRKPSAFSGLLGAARQAGLGEALMAQASQGKNGQLASALLGAAMSGDVGAATAALPASADPRTAQLAGAAVGTAMGIARSRAQTGCGRDPSAVGQDAPSPAAAAGSDTADVWR